MGRRYGKPQMAASKRYRRTIALLLRDGLHCWLCGAPFSADNRPTLDHIVPRSLGGSDDLDNLRLACGPCNETRDTDYEV